MLWIVVFAFACGGLWCLGQRADRPTELDPDVWVDDDAQRARNLRAKTAMWKAGKPYTSPVTLARIEAECEAARARTGPIKLSNPNAERPPRRLTREHPMRPAVWK